MRETGEPACPDCGYNLRGHAGDPVRCPECGREWMRNELARRRSKQREWPGIAFFISLIGGILSWQAPTSLAGAGDAWNGSRWWVWMVGSGLVVVVPAWLAPRRFWVWPFVVAGTQFLYMNAQARAGGLWPIGACMLLACAAIWQLGAVLGAACRR